MESAVPGFVLYAVPFGLALAVVGVFCLGLARAGGKEPPRRDEQVDAELEAMANATRCDCPRCTARHRRIEPS